MYKAFITAILVLPSIASIAGAYFLAVKDIYGWGWFLVIAFVLGMGAVPTINNTGKSNKSEIGN